MKPSRLVLTLFVAAGLRNTPAYALENLREVPARQIPMPDTASLELRAFIQSGSMPTCNDHPATAAEWKDWVGRSAKQAMQTLPALREKMGATVEASQITGVNVFT